MAVEWIVDRKNKELPISREAVHSSEMVLLETVASEYPLHLALAGSELCLYDWEEDREIVALPLSDKQRSAIQKLEPLEDDTNLPDASPLIDVVLADVERGLLLECRQNWLILCKELDEVFYEDIIALSITDEQVQTIADATERAAFYHQDSEESPVSPDALSLVTS